jgi:hypothetical protein
MDQITNALTSTPATGTPSATINYANLLVKIARPSSEMNHQSMMNLQKYGMLHQMYHSVLHQIYSVNSGVSNANIILSGITGRITMLIFVLRPTSGVNNDGSFTFTQITNFQLQSSGGTSLCGGQPISDSLYRDVLAKNWSDSTYLLDTSHGSYAYMWVFSSDIKTAVKTGTCLGNYPFTRSEQLQLNFTGSLGSAYQIDIYAYQETVLELTPSGTRKLYVNV